MNNLETMRLHLTLTEESITQRHILITPENIARWAVRLDGYPIETKGDSLALWIKPAQTLNISGAGAGPGVQCGLYLHFTSAYSFIAVKSLNIALESNIEVIPFSEQGHEIYQEQETKTSFHSLINYVRLVPGSTEVETLFINGAFDYKDADRDRRWAWPDSIYAPNSAIIPQEIARRKQAIEQGQARVCFAPARGGFCGQAIERICETCHRPICNNHTYMYTSSVVDVKYFHCPDCNNRFPGVKYQ